MHSGEMCCVISVNTITLNDKFFDVIKLLIDNLISVNLVDEGERASRVVH